MFESGEFFLSDRAMKYWHKRPDMLLNLDEIVCTGCVAVRPDVENAKWAYSEIFGIRMEFGCLCGGSCYNVYGGLKSIRVIPNLFGIEFQPMVESLDLWNSAKSIIVSEIKSVDGFYVFPGKRPYFYNGQISLGTKSGRIKSGKVSECLDTKKSVLSSVGGFVALHNCLFERRDLSVLTEVDVSEFINRLRWERW